jgi:hypothetical protein
VNAFKPRSVSCGVGTTTAVLVAALGLAGCQEGIDNDSPDLGEPDDSTSEVGDVAKPAVIGRANDLNSVIERTRFAFRAEGATLRATHPSLETAVRAGVVDVTPFHVADGVRLEGERLRLETVALQRGDLAMDTYVSDQRVDAQGRVEIIRADVVENITNSAAGIEQSWVFFDSPDAEGDLEVSVQVTGHRYVATTDSGLHFAAPGRLGFRYGHGTWIDAAGNETAVPARFEDGAIRLTVPRDIVENSSYPAVLDPTISAEVATDAPVVSFTGEQAINAKVATDGTGYLVVWRDNRNGTNSDIYGTRVAANGTVVDPVGLAIATDAGIQDHPAVAFVNGKYLVAWEDFRDPPVSGNIVAATVGTDGTVTRIGNVAATTSAETGPQIASRGATALLVFRRGDDVRGNIFNGTSFNSVFNVAAAGAVEAEPVVAADPNGNYLVAWTNGTTTSDIYARRVTSAGALTGSTVIVSAGSGAQITPTIAFNGTAFVIAWTNPGLAGTNRDIYGTRVSTAGAVLDTHLEGMTTFGGAPITTANAEQLTPSIACNGTSCFVAWRDRRNPTGDIFGRVVNNDFTLGAADVPVVAAEREQQVPEIIGSGAGFFGVWSDNREGGSYNTRSSRLAADGTALDNPAVLLNRGNNRESEPVAAVGSDNSWLTVWADSRTAGLDIVGVRIGSNGVVADSTARTIVGHPAQQSNPSIAYGDTHHLVVWEDGRNTTDDIMATRVTALGGVVDATPISIATAAADQGEPAVATSGPTWLVTWEDRRNAGNGWDVYGAIVNANGTVAVADIPICARTFDQYASAVTFDPASGNYFVVWSDVRNGAGTNDIYGARVTPAGAVLDDCGVPISTRGNGQLTPAVTAGGNRVFVAWDDRGNADADIYGARVNLAGGAVQVLDPAGLAVGTLAGSKQTRPTVGFVDNSYLVAWVDERNLATTGADIFANQVSISGALSTQFAVSTSAGNDESPYISAPRRSEVPSLLIYTRFDAAAGARRAFFRRITTVLGTGTVCSSNAQCDTGICVDGRCCDQLCGGGDVTDCQACSTARGAAVDGTCGPVAAGRICRNYFGGNQTFCDLRELCDGSSLACPADVGRRQGQACTTPANTPGVCPLNSAAGAPHVCQ